MKLHRLDDYQSWLIEASGRRIGVDPWLTAEQAPIKATGMGAPTR